MDKRKVKIRNKVNTKKAIKFDGKNRIECLKFMKRFVEAISEDPNNIDKIEIDTFEGVMTASIGDWIIEGLNGEFYSCKPDIFHKSYEIL